MTTTTMQTTQGYSSMTALGYRDDRRAIGDVLAGYTTLVQKRVDAGWQAHLLTMTFLHLPGSSKAVLDQMRNEAERFYRRFLTRVVRRPRQASSTGELPILVIAPHVPVGKSDKPLLEVVLNLGVHLHGLLLVPQLSRLRSPADEHVRTFQPFYVGAGLVDGDGE